MPSGLAAASRMEQKRELTLLLSMRRGTAWARLARSSFAREASAGSSFDSPGEPRFDLDSVANPESQSADITDVSSPYSAMLDPTSTRRLSR
jgi:hypothetical protein